MVLVESVVEFVRLLLLAVVLAVPVTLVAYAGGLMFRSLRAHKKVSWLAAFFSASFVLLFACSALLYAFPGFFTGSDAVGAGVTEVDFETLETDSFEPPVFSQAVVGFFAGVFRVAVVALVFSLLVLPVGFVSSAVYDWVRAARLPRAALAPAPKRKRGAHRVSRARPAARKGEPVQWPAFAAWYAAGFCGTLIALLVVLVFPWIPAGLFFFLFFA